MHKEGMLLNKQMFSMISHTGQNICIPKTQDPRHYYFSWKIKRWITIAATMLQNPELFKVAIPQVGVLDVLRFHKFTIEWA